MEHQVVRRGLGPAALPRRTVRRSGPGLFGARPSRYTGRAWRNAIGSERMNCPTTCSGRSWPPSSAPRPRPGAPRRAPVRREPGPRRPSPARLRRAGLGRFRVQEPGTIRLREWYDAQTGRVVPPRPGDAVPVLLVADDDATGSVVLSRREAVRWQRWAQVTARYREGDVVPGTVTQEVRGGLLVDIGFEAFLPASQIDVRRPTNLGDYVGRAVECTILRIDAARRSIIVSRRPLIELRAPDAGPGLLAAFEPGQGSGWAWSRTSPTSARSWTWAGSTACCTSRTCSGAG